jgi:excisionase family DNA binding protein
MWIRNPASRLLSIPRAAEELGVGQRTLLRAIKQREIETVDLQHRRYIPRSEIERIVKGRK